MKFQVLHVNPREKLKKKDDNNDLSHSFINFPIIHYGTCLLFSNTKSPISVLFDKYYVIVLHELWNVICRSNYGMFTGLYHNNLVHVQNIVCTSRMTIWINSSDIFIKINSLGHKISIAFLLCLVLFGIIKMFQA